MENIKKLLDEGTLTIDDMIEYLNNSHYNVIGLWED